MILGYHLILSAYGFWLPNDPRGSWSDVVRAFNLRRFGHATKVDTTRSVANQPHDQDTRFAAKKALRYPPVRFTGEQARTIVAGFADAAAENHYTIHALCILPDHAHLVIARHQLDIDHIARHLKAKATHRLSKTGRHPLAKHASWNGRIPSPWARNHWCPFIRSHRHMRLAIRYVEANPLKAGLPRQWWSIVIPHTG